MKKTFFILLGIILLGLGVFFYTKTSPLPLGKIFGGKTINKKPLLNITIEEAYKLCKKKSCVSGPVTIEGFLTKHAYGLYLSSGISQTDINERKIIVTNGPSLELIPSNLIEVDNNLNNKYLLGNGILKVKITGTLEYEERFFNRPVDFVKMHFNPNDMQILSEEGCLGNSYSYSYCFKPIIYTIDLDAAHKKLTSGKLYKKALKELNNFEIRKTSYDEEGKKWVFSVYSENIPYPGCCKDWFEVSQDKVLYKRDCIGNGPETARNYCKQFDVGFSLEE